jgi:hypothetical protein
MTPAGRCVEQLDEKVAPFSLGLLGLGNLTAAE